MTVTLVSGSAVTLVTGTETTLALIGRAGRFQLVADLVNFQQGDVIEFRSKQMVTPTGTTRVVEMMMFAGAQPADDMVKLSTLISNDQADSQAVLFTAKQTYGTGRSLLWKVLNVEDGPANFPVLGISGLGHILNVDLVGQVTGSAMSLVSGTSGGGSFDPALVWSFTGSRALNGLQQWDLSGTITNVFNVINQVLASGVVNPVVADVRSLVGVSGTVVVGTNNDKTGYSLASPQFVNFSGSITNVFNVLNDVHVSGTVLVNDVHVSGTVLASAVQGLVGISGTVEAVRGGFVTVSGAVTVGTVLDKTGYSLSSPQNFNLIGNISGSLVGNVLGYVGQVTGSVMSVVSGTSVSFDPALVWSFTGTRSLNGIQLWNLSGSIGGNLLGYVGQVTGSVMSVVSGTSVSFDPALVWSFTGSRSLNGLQAWNLIGNVSGTITNVYNVISGTQATFDPALVWQYTGAMVVDAVRGGFVRHSGSLSSPQVFDLIGNISGTIVGLNVTVTGVTIDASSVWNYSSRTLTSQIFNLPPVAQGNNLTPLRGDTLTWNPTALGTLVNHDKIYFTVKRKYTDLDSEALIQVSDVGGLLIINGQAATTSGNGSITINNVGTGDITVVVKAVEMAKLDVLTDVYYDVQLVRTDGSVTTLVYGLFTLLGDSSRATS